MNTEPFSLTKHKKILDSWFEKRACSQPPWNLVPPTGVVVSDEDGPLAAGFLTKTDSGFAIITNFISDPESDNQIRGEAVKLLIACLTAVATNERFKMVCVSTPISSVASKFERFDYKKIEENFINLGRVL